jgi:ankyrin repeat protein
MAAVEFNLLCAFETHSVDEIRAILDSGFDVATPIKGKSAVTSLTEMYSRSDAFPDCLRLLLDRGGVLDDPRIAPVLLDDAEGLAAALRADPALIHHRTSMISTFTPLIGASLLHVAAEYGNVKAARVLIEAGADVNARASVDEHGLNGHTPLFHTVNANDNRAAPILELLVAAGADPGVRLQGITWGKGFEWATTCFDVTPISYAQLGLLPQMHRVDRDVYANITRLLEASGRTVPPLDNVPNRYLQA